MEPSGLEPLAPLNFFSQTNIFPMLFINFVKVFSKIKPSNQQTIYKKILY